MEAVAGAARKAKEAKLGSKGCSTSNAEADCRGESWGLGFAESSRALSTSFRRTMAGTAKVLSSSLLLLKAISSADDEDDLLLLFKAEAEAEEGTELARPYLAKKVLMRARRPVLGGVCGEDNDDEDEDNDEDEDEAEEVLEVEDSVGLVPSACPEVSPPDLDDDDDVDGGSDGIKDEGACAADDTAEEEMESSAHEGVVEGDADGAREGVASRWVVRAAAMAVLSREKKEDPCAVSGSGSGAGTLVSVEEGDAADEEEKDEDEDEDVGCSGSARECEFCSADSSPAVIDSPGARGPETRREGVVRAAATAGNPSTHTETRGNACSRRWAKRAAAGGSHTAVRSSTGDMAGPGPAGRALLAPLLR